MTRMKLLLLAGASAGLLATGLLTGAADAATATSAIAALPSYRGTVKHFTITPRGAIDGVILSDGTDVMFPPYLSTQIAYAVKMGDSVTIKGLKAANEPVVQGVSIADGSNTVVDNGPPAAFGPGPRRMGPHGPGPHGPHGVGPHGPAPMGPHFAGAQNRMMVQGKVAQYLYGPHGEKNGVLLDNGTAVRLPPPALARSSIATLVKPGDRIAAVGGGTSNALGSVVMAQQIGADFKDLTRVAMPRPPHGPHGWPHGGPRMMHARMQKMGGGNAAPPAPASGSTGKAAQ